MTVSSLFGVGIESTSLSAREREILERHPPRAVILFRRNIEEAGQLDALVGEIRALPGAPWICVDQEGGPVDRFRDLLAASVSLRRAAEARRAREAGELAGEVCARFGIAVDLAPVVDRSVPGAGEVVLGERSASEDPEEVEEAAGQFLEGLHSRGVGGCLKHFPGLGRAALDTHSALPILSDDSEEQWRDLAPFQRLMDQAGAVMVSHAAGRDGIPASLSRAIATDLLRRRLGFTGAAFSDDLEMGALAAFGGLPERCAAAAAAGCDLLFVCRRIEEYPACVERVGSGVPEDRIAQARQRLDDYEAHIQELRRAAAPVTASLEELIADVKTLNRTK